MTQTCFIVTTNVDILYNTMNQELINITSWLSCNKLSLHVKKTHFMVFKTKRKRLDQAFEIKINDQLIEKVKCTKFLGLYIDDELSWRKHIDQLKMLQNIQCQYNENTCMRTQVKD